MRTITAVVVLLSITSALCALRFSWSAAGSTAPQRAQLAAAVVEQNSKQVPHRSEAADTAKKEGNRFFARLAADCAADLYARAKKQPDDLSLLTQAAAHFRACLSHEATTDAPELFADVRKHLAEVEKCLAEQKEREQREPAPFVSLNNEPPANTEPVSPPAEEARMFGPDGTVIRKAR